MIKLNKDDKIILTDADGVLLDWLGGFNDYMVEHGYSQKPGTSHMYELEVRFGISRDEIIQRIHDFNESDRIAHLEAFEDSVEYVTKLVSEGYKFVCVTSVSENPETKVYREQNLRKLFGSAFIEVICLAVGQDKQAVLNDIAGGSKLYWIEDHFKNAEAGHEAGLTSILIDNDYNSHFQTDLFTRVGRENPWKEIYEIVTAD